MKAFAQLVLFLSLLYVTTGRVMVANSDRQRTFRNTVNNDVRFHRSVDKISLTVLDTCSYRSHGRVVSAKRFKHATSTERSYEVVLPEARLDGRALFYRCLARYNQYRDRVQHEIGTAALALVNFASDFDVTDRNPLDTIEDAVGLVLQTLGRTGQNEIRTFSEDHTLLKKILNTPASYGKKLQTGEFLVPELFNAFVTELSSNDFTGRAGPVGTTVYGKVSANPPFIKRTTESG